MSSYDLLSEGFFADPYPVLAALRREAPCWHDTRLEAHVITRYHDIDRVLQDDRFSAKRVGQFGKGAPEHLQHKLAVYSRELERWLLFCDPPIHTRLRARLYRAFGPGLVPLIQATAAAAVAEALDAMESIAAPDLMRDFAFPVPTRVLARLLGIGREDIDRFKQWTIDIFALIGAGLADERAVEQGYRGATELRDYVLGLIRDRRAAPRDDVLSALAAPTVEGEEGITDEDIVGLFMTMVVAGHETTTNLLGNGLLGILSDVRARQWIRAHDGLTEEAVDELIRYDGPVFSLIRRAKVDLTLAGRLVRQGECVFSMLNAGNRDPRRFPEPDRIDFDRPRPPHLGFGVGMHACLGAAMARVVVREGVTQLLARFPAAAPAERRHWQKNMSIRGLAAFPLLLRPAAG